MFEAPVQEASAFPDMCPFDVHVKQQTVSTIELEWRPIPDTRVYKVLDLSSSKAVPDAAPLATYWGPATQCRITGLDSNRCYTFGVQAMQCEPTGGYTVLLSSEPVKVRTLKFCTLTSSTCIVTGQHKSSAAKHPIAAPGHPQRA